MTVKPTWHVQLQVNKKTTPSKETLRSIYVLAYNLYQDKEYAQAEDYFRFLTVHDIECRKYWVGLAATLQMQKKFEEALDIYGWAALMDENDPWVHYRAAECLIALKRSPEALQALKSVKLTTKDKALLKQTTLLQETWQ